MDDDAGPRCFRCGYSLAGLPRRVRRCPECGEDVKWALVAEARPSVRSGRVAACLVIPPAAGVVAILLIGPDLAPMVLLLAVSASIAAAIAAVHEVAGPAQSAWQRLVYAVLGAGAAAFVWALVGALASIGW